MVLEVVESLPGRVVCRQAGLGKLRGDLGQEVLGERGPAQVEGQSGQAETSGGLVVSGLRVGAG